MPEGELEKVMYDFVDGRYDVLCSTTIIESGLDIPRANTMIVNHAERFGLAQLYQLRGRIGRARERAFCYLVVPRENALSGEAKQRLAALQRFTELGAGFQIATHDLEIRGAGDLLGDRQHGLVAAVGFDTYVRILEEAVAELRGQPIKTRAGPGGVGRRAGLPARRLRARHRPAPGSVPAPGPGRRRGRRARHRWPSSRTATARCPRRRRCWAR